MKKDLRKELQEMKFLFGYERGRVISEQANLPMGEDEDMMFSDVETAEPETEVMPDTQRETRPSEPSRRERTFDPSRLPHENPDTHPQGKGEIEYELELDDKHFGDMDDEQMYDAEEEENEPFTQEVDTDVDSIEALVRKYLSSK